MQVIIPSAKVVGDDLKKLGNLPAVIYPLNRGIVFDYLFDQYSKIASSISIVCYEEAAKVHRRIENYPSSKIKLLDLPVLSDLGHTIFYALEALQGDVVINFADTIVLEDLDMLPKDGFYYSQDYQSERWTYYTMDNGRIESIIDKKSLSFDSNNFYNLFVGVFRFSDAQLLKRCLEEAFSCPDSSISSFYGAISKYSEVRGLTPVKTSNWFDIGHEDKYYSSTLEVKAREFNHIYIDKKRGILKKTSDDVEKFIGEIKWYIKLPSDIEYVRPRIFDYSTSYTSPYICMEYYAYHTLHELYLYGDLTKNQWRDIFSQIAFVCEDFKRYSVTGSSIKSSLEEMYFT